MWDLRERFADQEQPVSPRPSPEEYSSLSCRHQSSKAHVSATSLPHVHQTAVTMSFLFRPFCIHVSH